MSKSIALLCLLLSSQAFAVGVVLYPCHNYGRDVDYSYVSCVNRNFQDVQRETNLYLNYCSNLGPQMSYSFLSCINNNFLRIGNYTRSVLSYCANFGDYPSYAFVSCVNSNFRRVQNDLNQGTQR